MGKVLSIGIPTYNRSSCLDKNLSIIEDGIKKYQLRNDVDIIISNNCSTDATTAVVSCHKKKNEVDIISIDRHNKIPIQDNQVSVIEMSDADYVMHLSDDDYLDPDYLVNVVKLLKENKNIGCIIPNYIAVTPGGEFLFSKDPGAKSSIYRSGFDACLKFSKRAHQMSGLVYKRDNLMVEYRRRNVDNMYPFIFFISYCSLNGDVYYLADYPVKVTDVPQEKKDWNYGKDGLVLEVMDNYIKLDELTRRQISELEIDFIRTDPSRFLNYKKIHLIARAVILVIKSNKTLLKAKLFCLIYIPYLYVRRKLSRLVSNKKKK